MSQEKIRRFYTSAPATSTALQLTTQRKLRAQLGSHDKDSAAATAAGEFLKVKEIAATMRISSSVVVRLIKQGRLAAINVSGGQRPTYRVPRESFEEFRKTTMPVPPRITPHYKPKIPPWIHQFV